MKTQSKISSSGRFLAVNPAVKAKVKAKAKGGEDEAVISPASIRKGLEYRHVELLTQRGISRKEFLGLTKIASATLERRKKAGRLNTVESDKVYRLITIIEAAEQLFNGDREKALAWCRKSARGLGNQAPIELSDTTAGQDMVMDYIGRIEHGIPT